ncbi:hypothetical protein DPMN_191603 [Dreissena polymorpha]|uniref:Uncharacterized protein n=1 Tax=Dreissena polymorpha TaxID=45954 RepID=A0A9D3Y1L1_DREPO|nr:hypothetical protein DPMN_191603 [Dreissena polymorpha]
MFTVIPRPLIIDHNVADKNVDVIDHNADQKPRKWTRDPNKASRKDSLSLPELLKQKDDLLEADMKNRKRIKELEKEREEVLTLFEPTYKENQALRGHILYGPATVKIRELQKERKELHDYVLKLVWTRSSEDVKCIPTCSGR